MVRHTLSKIGRGDAIKKKILIGIVVVILLIAAVVAITFKNSGDERAQATEFVTEIASGDTKKAYGQFSNGLKDVQSQAEFESQVSSLGLDKTCKLNITGFESNVSTDKSSETSIKGKIECSGKTLNSAQFTYTSDNQLNGYRIRP